MPRREFRSEAEVLASVRQFVREELRGARLGEDGVFDLVLSVSEAAAKIVQYTPETEFSVEVSRRDDGAEVLVQDGGTFDRSGMMHAMRTGAFGLALMVGLADEVHIDGGREWRRGCHLRLVMRERP